MLKSLVASGLGAILLSSAAYAQDSYDLQFQSSDNAGTSTFEVEQRWADHLREMSDGRIDVEMMPVGSIVEYNETLDAIGAGILDGHVTDSSYFTGKDAAFALIGNPSGAFNEPEELVAFYKDGGGKEMYNEILEPYGVHFIGAGAQTAESLNSKVPLEGIEDLKGVKVRAPEGMIQSAFAAAGASPVNLPQSEVFTALDKGVISAADATTLATNNSMGLHDVAKHPVWPGFHSLPIRDVSITKSLWDSMSEADRKLFEDSVDWYAEEVAATMREKDEETAAKLREGGEVTVHSWSDEDKTAYRKLAREQWETYAQQSANAQKVYDTLTAYLEEQGQL